MSICVHAIDRSVNEFDKRIYIESIRHIEGIGGVKFVKNIFTDNSKGYVLYIMRSSSGKLEYLSNKDVEFRIDNEFYNAEVKDIKYDSWYNTLVYKYIYSSKMKVSLPQEVIEKITNAKEVMIRITLADSTTTYGMLNEKTLGDWKEIIATKR